jgi:hypothetical protein
MMEKLWLRAKVSKFQISTKIVFLRDYGGRKTISNRYKTPRPRAPRAKRDSPKPKRERAFKKGHMQGGGFQTSAGVL